MTSRVDSAVRPRAGRSPVFVLAMSSGPTPAPAARTRDIVAEIKNRKCRVLVVEDHPVFARGVELILTHKYGASVKLVTAGPDAIATCRQESFHLVLMDILLAGPMNGITACQAMRAAGIEIPIVLMSAYRRSTPETAALGITVLRKPLDYTLLEPFLMKCGDHE